MLEMGQIGQEYSREMFDPGVGVPWDPRTDSSTFTLSPDAHKHKELHCSLCCIFPWWGNNFMGGLYGFMLGEAFPYYGPHKPFFISTVGQCASLETAAQHTFRSTNPA